MAEKTIRITELFGNTIQGEGFRTGVNSTFLRSAGCNFRCKSFGLKKGEENTEIPMIIKNIDQYRRYEDLPLSKTGCDSYPASWPEFKRFSKEYTYDQLYQAIAKETGNPQYKDFVITGGEPLLKGTQKKLVEFMTKYIDYFNQFESLTFETNGSQVVIEELRDFLVNKFKKSVIFSVSPKLSCSGEPKEKTVIPAAIESYKKTVKDILANRKGDRITQVYLKFVVSDEQDVREIESYMQSVNFTNHVDGDVYLMPVGGTVAEYNGKVKEVAELAIKYNYRYCYRVHVAVFSNLWKC